VLAATPLPNGRSSVAGPRPPQCAYDLTIKYLTHAHGPLLGLLSPWTLTALASFVISFYASARSLQIGLAVEVIARQGGERERFDV